MKLPAVVEASITQRAPFLWINESWQPFELARFATGPNLADVYVALNQLNLFSGLLATLFPELASVGGVIESPLLAADGLQRSMQGNLAKGGRWMIKADHALPVAGSIKARGGIYEVLLHAKELAINARLIEVNDDLARLGTTAVRALFAQHHVVVGSTGNLGLSIGVMAAALGFRATVHMSREAKAWKKQRLRENGVEVIEHMGDFGAAVAAGREQAQEDSKTYFVDDENSTRLFLGYSTAAPRLGDQLREQGIRVSQERPLFVYLPCGVGGAPGGITFGLRHLFGDHVHCFLAEPVSFPCMLVRLASLGDCRISVKELALNQYTEADGLAVAQASEFVAPLIKPLVSGVFTVLDEELLEDLYRVERTEGLRIEPSAAAGFRGAQWLIESNVGQQYLKAHNIENSMHGATHIFWTTGGSFVPQEEYWRLHELGRQASVTSVAAKPNSRG